MRMEEQWRKQLKTKFKKRWGYKNDRILAHLNEKHSGNIHKISREMGRDVKLITNKREKLLKKGIMSLL